MTAWATHIFSLSFPLHHRTPTSTMTRCSSLALTVLSLVFNVLAVTLYIPEGQETLFGIKPTSTDVSPASTYTGAAAYDPRTLVPPVPPTNPPVNTQFGVQLVSGDIPGLSIRHHGAFLGFSVELSVSNHIRECALTSALVISLIKFPAWFPDSRSGSQWVRSLHSFGSRRLT